MKNCEKEIKWYLDKNYYVKERKFFNVLDGSHEWGFQIADLLSSIFSYSLEDSRLELTKWAYENDLDENSFELAFGRKKLKVKWSPEMAHDLQSQYGITSAEEQLTRILADEISKEIDAEILRTMRDEIKTSEDLIGVVKCLGYETSQLIYDPHTFTPQKYFISTTYNEMIDERQNNLIWQNWVRTREQN
jgi:hypothetical protein